MSVVGDRRHKSVDAYYILRSALQLRMQLFPDPARRIGILVLINSRGQHLVREPLVARVKPAARGVLVRRDARNFAK